MPDAQKTCGETDATQAPAEVRQRATGAGRITMNIWAVGLIPDITELAIRMRAIGSLNYSVASPDQAASGTNRSDCGVKVDGAEREVDCNFIWISNSRFTGGAMEIAAGGPGERRSPVLSMSAGQRTSAVLRFIPFDFQRQTHRTPAHRYGVRAINRSGKTGAVLDERGRPNWNAA